MSVDHRESLMAEEKKKYGEPVISDGILHLTEWYQWHDGRQYNGLRGRIEIFNDISLLGFKVRDDHNWGALVEGPTERAFIPACKIRGVVQFKRGPFAEIRGDSIYTLT